ncbi:serine protease SohB [Marinospirillum alkaliphilum DSM 21637]|uniref:Serine protease SohB n=2 Tax=Marinospirillum TaxID=64968 RepID=A0A1K1UCT7_9GAMM|nr:serine protease SohB [Marinospirillum alkaliphilum DSM 21637]
MELLGEYLVFLLKTLTLLAGLGLLVVILVSVQRSRMQQEQLEVESLNEHHEAMQDALQEQWLDAKAFKQMLKAKHKKDKQQQQERAERPRVFVLDFKGDLDAGRAPLLGREISLLLALLRPQDEVVVRLESAGGFVHSYGHAAAQLQRLRERDIRLTVCVDRVAASGGYMMACTAHTLLATPFAVIGSIGVVAELPNFHRLLKSHEVDYEVLTAGEYKRTLTLFGENTEEGRSKFLQDLEQAHQLFKSWVQGCRPQLNIDQVAKGEVWYGEQALALQLVDRLCTSEAYLLERMQEAEVFKVQLKKREPLAERIAGQAAAVLEKRLLAWWPKLQAPFTRR